MELIKYSQYQNPHNTCKNRKDKYTNNTIIFEIEIKILFTKINILFLVWGGEYDTGGENWLIKF